MIDKTTKSRSVKTPEEIQKALLLRSAGYSVSAIALKTQISVSTLERHFSKHKIAKGILTDKAIQEAQQQLIVETSGDMKLAISSVLADDMAQFHQIRAALSASVEKLINDDSLPPHYVLRGLAAAAVTLKTSGEVARRALKIDEQVIEQESLPELFISELTSEDIATMRQAQLELSGELIDNELDDDNTIIETTE